MPKSKIVRNQEIPEIPIKEATAARVATPFLRRVNSENIREEELSGVKLKFIRQSAVVRTSFTKANATLQPVTFSLTAYDANIIRAWIEITIFSDYDLNLDYIWPNGVSSGNAFRVDGPVYQIADLPHSGLKSNQARAGFSINNASGGNQTYYIYGRWFYLIIE